MDSFYAWQIQIIQFMQSLGSWLDLPFKTITFLGNEQFYLLIAPALYWCINAAAGLRMGIFLGITSSLNTYIKFLFHAPRPYWITTQVHALVPENSFGLPSGHAQNGIMVFGSLYGTYRLRWVLPLVAGIALLVGLSRVYLAVHFTTDVLAGWLIGAVLLWASLKVEPMLIGWFKQRSQVSQYLIILATSLGIIFLGWLIRLLFSAWVLPAEWVLNASSAFPEEPPLDPFRLSGLVTAAGSFLGLTSGAVYLANRGGWSTQGSPMQLAARYIIGVVGVLVIYIGLDLLFPDGEDLVAFCFRYIRYALVGLWVSALAPLIFRRIRLAVNLP